jgi:hypothetical protein
MNLCGARLALDLSPKTGWHSYSLVFSLSVARTSSTANAL